jgi:rod shape-determining protein MreD
MNSENAVQLPLRIFLIALFAVVIQECVVSEISIFGTTADVTPLVVMSVGLLCGSLPGAIVGFCKGLFVDTVQFQTLGITSLLFIVIGYWSGRLKELRAPSHGLVPLMLGAAATAVAGVGMAVIQFLLGVDAPVSLLLVQQIFMTILINTLIVLPVYEVVKRIVYPALPGDPRRRRRKDRRYGSGDFRSPLQQPSQRLSSRAGR